MGRGTLGLTQKACALEGAEGLMLPSQERPVGGSPGAAEDFPRQKQRGQETGWPCV